jgi:hypothetical protein
MRAKEMVIYDGERVAIFRSPCSCTLGEGLVRFTSDLAPGRDIDGPFHCTLFVQDSDAAYVSFHVPQWTRFPGGRPIVLELRSG